MPRVTHTVEAPLQGLSQASPLVMLPAQSPDLLNALVVIPDGFKKRPPLEYRGKLANAGVLSAANFKGHLIEGASMGSPYDVFLLLGDLGTVLLRDAVSLVNIPVTVTASAQDYLEAGLPEPIKDFRLLTIEDYTFICNRKVPVALNPTVVPTRPFEAIIWVKLADYSRTITVTIAGITSVYLPPEGNAPDDADDLGTDFIVDRILNGGAVTSNGTVTPSGGILSALTSAGFTVVQSGSFIFLSRATDFSITIKDGLGETAVVALKGSTPLFGNLPKYAPTGFTIKIAGASASDKDDYFVQFTGTGSTGVWKETIEPGSTLGVLGSSLPVSLVYDQGTSTWTLDVSPWGQREVGNLSLAPDPLTAGDIIQSIGWFRGRLRLLTSEGALYTGADSPFRLYPSTLTTALASDPIEIANPDTRRAFFKEGVPFDTRDVLMGTRSQAIVSSEGPFTLTTVKANVLSQYPFNDDQPPLPAGDNVHFTMNKGADYAGIWELNINGPLQRTQGEDLTVAIPKLLPQGLDRGAILKDSYASLRFRGGDLKAYLHVYRSAGQERIQSGFFPLEAPEGWTFAEVNSQDYTFYVYLWDPSGALHLCTMDLSSLRTDGPGLPFLTTLDLRLDETQVTLVYEPTADFTLVVAPYDLTPDAQVSVRSEGQAFPLGMLATKVGEIGDLLKIQGDWTDVELYVGLPYTARWVLPRVYHYGQDGTPLEDGGLLGLREIAFSMGPTGFLQVTTQVAQRDPRLYTISEATFDQATDQEGRWVIPVGGTNYESTITVTNDSHLQGTILRWTWTGEHNLRSQAV